MSINFLSKTEWVEASRTYRMRALSIFALLSSVAFFAGALVLLPILQVLPEEKRYALAEIREAENQLKNSNLDSVEDEVDSFNRLLAETDSLFVPRISPSETFRRVFSHVPAGVQITSMSLGQDKINVSGSATTREAFLFFIEELRADSTVVRAVASPVGNVITPKNSDFAIVISLLPIQ